MNKFEYDVVVFHSSIMLNLSYYLKVAKRVIPIYKEMYAKYGCETDRMGEKMSYLLYSPSKFAGELIIYNGILKDEFGVDINRENSIYKVVTALDDWDFDGKYDEELIKLIKNTYEFVDSLDPLKISA